MGFAMGVRGNWGINFANSYGEIEQVGSFEHFLDFLSTESKAFWTLFWQIANMEIGGLC
jgi:hypothetical protein